MVKNILYSLLIFSLAFIFRAYAIPHLHHVYHDEFTYLNIAENINNLNIFSPTLMGDKNHVDVKEASIRPNGYPLFLSFAFKLLGDSEETVFLLNILLGALSVVLIFWIAYLIFENNLNIAFWTAVVFNFLPAHLKYSGSGNADVASLFFILVSLWVVLLYLKGKRLFLLYLSISAAVYSAYIKPENLIFCLLFLILIPFLYANKKISKRDLILLISFISALFAPLLIRVPFMVSNEQVNAEGAFLSLEHLRKNSLVNLQYLFDFRFHSLVSTVFFVLGGVLLFFQEKKKWLFLFGWFLVFWLINSSYFFGMFSLLYSSDSDRHFFFSAISFSILSGYGISVVLKKTRLRLILALIILNLLIVNSTFATERIVNYTFERNVYKEYLYLKESTRKIPDDLFVITYEPSAMITIINKKVMGVGILTSLNKYPSQIMLFKGFWWFENKEKSEFYEKLLASRYDSKVITERRIDNVICGFYLLTLKS